MSYKVEFTERALSEFSLLPKKVRDKLAVQIAALADDPRPTGASKIEGQPSCYRLRKGDYRIVYAVLDDQLFVLIVRAGHRKEVYKGMESLARRIVRFTENRQ